MSLDELVRLAQAAAPPAETRRYGPLADHQADLYAPSGESRAEIALLHGGFWRAAYTRELMAPLAVDLARRDFSVWNLEYRRVGAGGGVPETLDDVASAVRTLCPGALAVGHSAGGHLALWLGGERLVAGAVSLGGVCDLGEAARLGLGSGAADEFTRGRPEAYERADPMRRLPTGVPQLLVHGDRDDRVPVDLARRYAAAARAAGDECELMELDGVGHFELIDPRTDAWAAALNALDGLVA
jgi:acetyl esterase/lipase